MELSEQSEPSGNNEQLKEKLVEDDKVVIFLISSVEVSLLCLILQIKAFRIQE